MLIATFQNRMNEEVFNNLVTLLTKVSGGPVTSNLFEAALSGNIKCLQEVVNEGIYIYGRRLEDAGRPDPLQIAINNGKELLAKYLIENGLNVNATDSDGNTPLIAAVGNNLTKLTEILLEKGANINHQSNNGQSPLHIAVSEGNVELARNLIGRGANIDSKTAGGSTPLHIVIQESITDREHPLFSINVSPLVSFELCKLLIGEGADLNITDERGNTALHHAAEVENVFVAEMLLFKGAAINVRNTDGKTPLHISFSNKKPSLCIMLLKEGADVSLTDEEGNTCLHLFFTSNFPPSFSIMFEKLIDMGVDINKKNKKGDTALMIAIENKSFEDIMLLINRGADINVQNNNRDTPLLLALKCFEGNLELLSALTTSTCVNEKDKKLVAFCDIPKKLILKGANVNVQDNEGNTPLYIAYLNSLGQYTDLLLDSGSDVNVKNTGGNTPLHIALSRYDLNFLENLLERNIDLDFNIQNERGETPLHQLLMSEDATNPVPPGLLQMLIDYGARVDIKNSDSQAPFHIARLHSESEQILTKHITKMKIAGLSVMIGSEINNEDTAIRCLAEMEQIKATKINSIHFLDKLFSHNKSPRYLLTSETFIENVLLTPLLKEMFPLYASLLRLQYKLASERLRLIELADCSLKNQKSQTTYLEKMPDVIMAQIIQYLENEDLKRLIKSMQLSKKMLYLNPK